MTDDEAALLGDVRLALRGLDPWPPKGQLKICKIFAGELMLFLSPAVAVSAESQDGQIDAVDRATARQRLSSNLPAHLSRYGVSARAISRRH
jgi:hypothetical protein